MMKRVLLAMLLALTGVMVATTPVVAMSAAGQLFCLQMEPEPTQAPMQGAVHGAAHDASMHRDHAAAPDLPATTGLPMPACCDHACLFEPATVTGGHGLWQSASPAFLASLPSDLAELAQPDGLRRPPRG